MMSVCLCPHGFAEAPNSGPLRRVYVCTCMPFCNVHDKRFGRKTVGVSLGGTPGGDPWVGPLGGSLRETLGETLGGARDCHYGPALTHCYKTTQHVDVWLTNARTLWVKLMRKSTTSRLMVPFVAFFPFSAVDIGRGSSYCLSAKY